MTVRRGDSERWRKSACGEGETPAGDSTRIEREVGEASRTIDRLRPARSDQRIEFGKESATRWARRGEEIKASRGARIEKPQRFVYTPVILRQFITTIAEGKRERVKRDKSARRGRERTAGGAGRIIAGPLVNKVIPPPSRHPFHSVPPLSRPILPGLRGSAAGLSLFLSSPPSFSFSRPYSHSATSGERFVGIKRYFSGPRPVATFRHGVFLKL